MSGANEDAGSYHNPYTDPVAVAAAELLLREVVGRLQDHPGVWAWNLGNEPDNFALPHSDGAGAAWCRRMFAAIAGLILALAIASVLEPNLINSMIAVSLMWWPWYTRLVYGLASAQRNEYYVSSAEITGASTSHILFREILPNTLSPIFTKMSLDMGWVIIIGASLSFVGLGVQPPKPGLGTMVASGAKFLPDQWWISLFPALAIVVLVLGFNLLGDGLRDMFAAEEV